jgi:hypothetical protein
MRPALRGTQLAFAAVSVCICLATLAPVQGFDTPTLEHALAFVGGFFGALVVGLAFLRVRRTLLAPKGTSQQAAMRYANLKKRRKV